MEICTPTYMDSKITVWFWCVGNIPIWKVSHSGSQPSFILNLPWCSHTLLLGLSINVCPMYFSGGSVVKNLPANTGDAGSTPGSGRSPGVGNDNPLQYSRVENPIDTGAWQATVQWGCKEPNATEQLSTHAGTHAFHSIVFGSHPYTWSFSKYWFLTPTTKMLL